MDEEVQASSTNWPLQLTIIGAGLWAVMWLFFTYVEVVTQHTHHAQHVSRTASWMGYPVGTTPQPTLPAFDDSLDLQQELRATGTLALHRP